MAQQAQQRAVNPPVFTDIAGSNPAAPAISSQNEQQKFAQIVRTQQPKIFWWETAKDSCPFRHHRKRGARGHYFYWRRASVLDDLQEHKKLAIRSADGFVARMLPRPLADEIHARPAVPTRNAATRKLRGLRLYMVNLYLVINLINGKKYFGKTIGSIHDRWTRHVYLSKTNSNNYFSRAIKKYRPENFKRLFLEAVDESQGSTVEQSYIKVFNTSDRLIGYNSTFGGEGVRATPETKKKISEALTGRKASPEHIEKLRAKALGKVRHWRYDVRTSDLISKYNLGWTTRQVAKHFSVDKSCVSRRLKKAGIVFRKTRHSLESKEKIRKSNLERLKDPQYREQLRVAGEKGRQSRYG